MDPAVLIFLLYVMIAHELVCGLMQYRRQSAKPRGRSGPMLCTSIAVYPGTWKSSTLAVRTGRGGRDLRKTGRIAAVLGHIPLVPSILTVAKKDLISEDMVFPIATVIVDMVVAYRVSMNTQLSDPIKEVTARRLNSLLPQEHFQNASAHSNVAEEVAFFNKVLLWWCEKHGVVERAQDAARAPHLDDETKMSDLISDLHALGAFSASRRSEGQANFNNAHANFLCAIAKRGSDTSQWCTKRTRGFVSASGDDLVRLERGMISEMWSVFSMMGVADWGAFIKFLTQSMLEMGLKECTQVMHQAANSGHTSCVLIHRAVLGRPDFNWAQIMSGTHTRQMRPTDPQFEDFNNEWYQNKMAEAPLDQKKLKKINMGKKGRNLP
ncbi:unnamed protein product [Boreogadus saida]